MLLAILGRIEMALGRANQAVVSAESGSTGIDSTRRGQGNVSRASRKLDPALAGLDGQLPTCRRSARNLISTNRAYDGKLRPNLSQPPTRISWQRVQRVSPDCTVAIATFSICALAAANNALGVGSPHRPLIAALGLGCQAGVPSSHWLSVSCSTAVPS
jgi:hypothetical protein